MRVLFVGGTGIISATCTQLAAQVPLAINSWAKSYTVVDRMRRGSLVGLLGHRQAIGHAFRITSDEVMCWDQYERDTREAFRQFQS